MNPYWLVRAASWLVPAYLRQDWTEEWEAELRHAHHAMFVRGEPARDTQSRLWRFAMGSVQDAMWHRAQLWQRERMLHRLHERGFCLTALACLIGVILILSGGLPMTRDVMLPLPYADASRIATVAQSGIAVATRSPVLAARASMWQERSRLLEDVATYTWKHDNATGILAAQVSEDFFAMLGTRTTDGLPLDPATLRSCEDCAVLSYDYWRGHYSGKMPATVTVSSKTYAVIAVLEKPFWFLSRDVAVWSIAPMADRARDKKARSGVVVKLRPDVSARAAEAELQAIIEDTGIPAYDALVEIVELQGRVRSVLSSFALALGLAMVIIITSLHLRLSSSTWQKPAAGSVLFFLTKTTLALSAVLLAGLEFTHAPSITMLGGTDMWTEPLSTWLFLMGCLGALTWSVADQRHRCRVCLRRLGMAAHVGCSGSLLLNWAGTELVCIEGHGMLHVPEMASSWHEPDHWTVLDESWNGLFARR